MADIQTTFEKTKITVQGLRLLTKIMLTAESLKLTRAAIGEGISDADPSSLTALVKEVPSHKTGTEGTSATVDLQTLDATDETTACVRILVQNGDTAFTLREIGIYAQDPDGSEILYAYTRDRSEYAMPFPSNADGAHVSETVDIAFFVSNVENIEADITLPAEISLAEFNLHKTAEELDHPDGSVTNKKIEDGAITLEKLADGAVSERTIASDAVTTDKIADNAVTEAELADGCVTSEQIVDGAVSEEKLSTQLQDQLKKFDSELKLLAEQMKLPAYLSCYSKSVDEESRCSIDISVDKESDQVDIDITEIGDMCVDRMFYEYVEAHEEFSVASGSSSKTIQGLSQFNEGVYVQAAMICNLPAGTATIDVLYKGYANGLPPSPDVCKYNAEDSTVSIFLGEAHCEKNDENWSNARTIQTPTAPIEKGTQKISLLN